MYLSDQFVFDKQFVRTIAMRFWKGSTDLDALHAEMIAAVNGTTNETDIHDIPLPGDPVLDAFQHDEPKAADAPADMSVMVQLEVQYVRKWADFVPDSLKQKTVSLMGEDGWIYKSDNKSALWLRPECFDSEALICDVVRE